MIISIIDNSRDTLSELTFDTLNELYDHFGLEDRSEINRAYRNGKLELYLESNGIPTDSEGKFYTTIDRSTGISTKHRYHRKEHGRRLIDGDTPRKPLARSVRIDDEEYPTKRAAAKALNCDEVWLGFAINNGTLDKYMKLRRSDPRYQTSEHKRRLDNRKKILDTQ